MVQPPVFSAPVVLADGRAVGMPATTGNESSTRLGDAETKRTTEGSELR